MPTKGTTKNNQAHECNQGNRVEEQVNIAALQEVATPVVHREPLLILWKNAKLVDFDGVGDLLIAQGWFMTTETIIEAMELSNNEKFKCAFYSLTMDVKIWWETVQLKYDVDQMTWAQFTEEFNEHFFNTTIMVDVVRSYDVAFSICRVKNNSCLSTNEEVVIN